MKKVADFGLLSPIHTGFMSDLSASDQEKFSRDNAWDSLVYLCVGRIMLVPVILSIPPFFSLGRFVL